MQFNWLADLGKWVGQALGNIYICTGAADAELRRKKVSELEADIREADNVVSLNRACSSAKANTAGRYSQAFLTASAWGATKAAACLTSPSACATMQSC